MPCFECSKMVTCDGMSDLQLQIPTDTLGERMRRARRHAGLTATEMAHDLGLHKQMISRYENDRNPPKRVVLLAYAMRCGVPVEWLEGSDVDGLPTGRYARLVWRLAAA